MRDPEGAVGDGAPSGDRSRAVRSNLSEGVERIRDLEGFEVEGYYQKHRNKYKEVINSTARVVVEGQKLIQLEGFGWHWTVDRYSDTERKYGRFQDPDYPKFTSKPCIEPGGSRATVYNTRVAWALAWFGSLVGNEDFVEAALRNAEYALDRQLENGWFGDCCLDDPQRPLVHTLAYAARGLWELGVLLDRDDLADAGRKTVEALLGATSEDGFLAGRFDRDFRPSVRWCCMTGSAQTAIILAKLHLRTRDPRHLEGARRLVSYVMRHHDVISEVARIRGGVTGSWPISGDYGRFRMLNWATKFFLDACLLLRRIERDAAPPD